MAAILIFLALSIVLVYFIFYKPHQYWKNKQVLHVKPLPIFGNMWGFIRNGCNFPEWLQTIYYHYNARYFGIYQFLTPTLLIKDTELIKQIAIKDFDYFVDHKFFFTESKEPVFKHNLLSLKGQRWKDMRATLSPAFTSSKMRAMFQLMSKCSEEFANHFASISPENKLRTVNIKEVFTRYTNDIIATCAFGFECNSLKEKENEFYLRGKDVGAFDGIRAIKFIGYIISPNIMNWLRINLYSKNLISFFRNLVSTTMDFRKKENIVRPDMIHLLMEARKGNLKHESIHDETAGYATAIESYIGKMDAVNKPKLTDDEIAGQVLLFFIAGFETSSTALTFMAYELALNEDIQRKLQDEIDETMDLCAGKISYDALIKMKYLDMIISETLRKWPIAYFINRVCVKPYTIQPVTPDEKPVHLEKGDTVWFPSYSLHRDEAYFPNPDKFDPERFNDENKEKINPFAYLPFGIGPRNCIGSRFALLQSKAILVHLLWKFDLVVVKETQIPVKLITGQLFLGAQDGISLGLKLRNKESH